MKKQSPNVEQASLKIEDVITYISPLDLIPNPYQPKSRAQTSPEEARAGWLSLERSGLIHFPVVRKAKAEGKYEVGDGWQRRNWYLYGWKEQKNDKYARVPCVVKELTDEQMADLIPEANSQRKDFSPIEWAEFYKKYIEDFKVTQEEAGRRFRKSQGEIANTIRLLDLPEPIKEKIISHEITESHGRELLRLNRMPAKQEKLAKEIKEGRISVVDLSRRIEGDIYQASKSLNPDDSSWNHPPAFDVKKCDGCDYIEKVGGKNRCLNDACWNDKQKIATAAAEEKVRAEFKAQGIDKVYPPGVLKGGETRQLYPDFIEASPDCRKCVHRAAVGHQYDNEYSIFCIDTECYDRKRNQKQAADQAAREKEIDLRRRRIEEAVERCDDENITMQGIILMLSDEWDERGYAMFGVKMPDDPPDDYDIDAELQKALDNLNPHGMAKALLRGWLLLGVFDETAEKILARLEGKAKAAAESKKVEPEPKEPIKDLPCNDCAINADCDRSHFTAGKKGGYKCRRKVKDIFAGLEIHIAMDESEPHQFRLGEISISGNSLKEGVIELVNRVGITDGRSLEETLTELKRLPATPNIARLVGILETGQSEGEAVKPDSGQKFTKSVRCSGCGEKKMMEFHRDPGNEGENHWLAPCPKCKAKNSIKNTRWDAMLGKYGAGEAAK